MSCSKSRRYRKLSLIVQETANPLHSLSESLLWPLKRSTCESRFDSVRLTSFKNVHMEGVLCGGSRDHAGRRIGGIQVKGAGPLAESSARLKIRLTGEILWRRPSWVRIPSPAPFYPNFQAHSSIMFGPLPFPG